MSSVQLWAFLFVFGGPVVWVGRGSAGICRLSSGLRAGTLAYEGCRHTHHRFGRLNNRTVFSGQFWRFDVQEQVSARLVSSGTSLLGLPLAASVLCVCTPLVSRFVSRFPLLTRTPGRLGQDLSSDLVLTSSPL